MLYSQDYYQKKLLHLLDFKRLMVNKEDSFGVPLPA